VQPKQSSSLLLCIETSGSLCGVALADAASQMLLAELSFSEPFLHDRLLAEATRSLLTMSGIALADLAAVAVSAGPGSFTGLRIGAAFAKALCFENLPKLLAVPTLQAIALAAAPAARLLGKESVCVGIPSHKNLVYVQHFSLDNVPLGAIELLDETSLTSESDIFYAGRAFLGNARFQTLPELCRITPAMIAGCAITRFQEQAFLPAEDFVPLYAQEFVPKSPLNTTSTIAAS
jgi:tRNA threonylcarbamoyladenosine biosynthesis protein TsaB